MVSFLITFVLAVPFINLLYRLKFQRQKEAQKDIFGQITSVVNRLHGWKVGTPNAGGVLIIVVSIVLSVIFYKLVPGYDILTQKDGINWSSAILYLTLIAFGLLGLYDDIRKFYGFSAQGAWGLRTRFKFFLQWVIALIIGYLLYKEVGLNSISVPVLNSTLNLGAWYIPFAAGVIVATTNAVNIADGLDGLAVGLIVIALLPIWYLAGIHNQDVSLFIAVILGSLLAFLYFNIFPARVWLGDTGALALGAMLATIALLIDSSLILPFVGLVFVIEASSSLLQWISKATRGGKRIFIAAPIHHHFEAKGWDETKVTMRFWLVGSVSAFFGLFVALFGK